MLKYTLSICFLFFIGRFYCQEKEKGLPEVRIDLQKDSILLSGGNQRITAKNIALSTPEDIGTLTQKIAGVTLKNYGGIGGMKTIAFRGISGTNTAIIMDGFSLQNNMVGQLDLSNLQVDNLVSLSFSSGNQMDELLPITALMQGNILSINTYENKYANDKLEVRYTSKAGSFGLVDNYGSLKRRFSTAQVSFYGKLRSFNGVYPYTIENGNSNETSLRKNNALQEGFAGLNYIRYIGDRVKFHSSFHFNQSKRGLPGAVILYNETANQHLNQQNAYWNTELDFRGEKSKFRVYNSLNYGYLNYLDPSYLNNSGGLNQWYFNTVNQTGISFNRKLMDSTLYIFGGLEHTFSTLTAPNQYTFSPTRFHLQSLIGLKSIIRNAVITMQLGNHFVQNKQGISVSDTKAWTSFLNLEKKVYSKRFGLPRTWFKQTFRMPSFSELYYNSIGNKALKPELTLQFNLGTSYRFLRNTLHLSIDAYYNKTDNKILAIPTKNLFVWSIQNIGKVQVFGIDLLAKKTWDFKENFELNVSLNYSFQKVQDISDPKSATYKNQLAYFPMHTLQSDLTLTLYKKMGVYISNSTLSNRYVLNENSAANLLNGFSTFDFTCFYKIPSYKKNTMKISGSVKNCLNTSYQYISYFVMPGRNYLITLSYAFN